MSEGIGSVLWGLRGFGVSIFPTECIQNRASRLMGGLFAYESGKKPEIVWNYGVFAGLLLLETGLDGLDWVGGRFGEVWLRGLDRVDGFG